MKTTEITLSPTGMFTAYRLRIGDLVVVKNQTYELVKKIGYTKIVVEGPLSWYWRLYHKIKAPFVRMFPEWVY